MEFCGCEAYALSWEVCKNVIGTLVCICVGSDNICFNNKIDNNRVMAIKIEDECTN